MATKIYKTLKELENDSIAISTPIRVTNFIGQEETYTPDVAKFPGCYASNNSTLAYVVEGTLYVTPFTLAALKCLQENEFTENSFYVPFSNGDYPTEEKARWRRLHALAKKEHIEEFKEDCISHCEKNAVGKLSEDLLSKCFEMPQSGVLVQRFNYKNVYYPAIQNNSLDSVGIQHLGKFCCNNGKVVFVYRNGTTYVAKGYKILDALRSAGYKESGLFVPFSNGEEILDPTLASQWAAICSQN